MSQSGPSSPTFGRRSEVVDNTIRVNQSITAARSHLVWSAVNAVVFSIILYHLSHISVKKHKVSVKYWLECIAAAVFLVNTIYNFSVYLKRSLSLPSVVLSPTQRKLLGVRNSDPNFKDVTAPKKDVVKDSSCSTPTQLTSLTPMNLSASSWLSQCVLNESTTSSPNYSIASPSWVYQPSNTPTSIEKRSSMVTSEDFISDKSSLDQYLHDVDDYEKKASVSTSLEYSSNIIGSFWSHQASKITNEVSPLLRRCVYQIAPLTPITPVTSSPGSPPEETGSPQLQQDLWRRLKVDHAVLTQWNANLRLWISQTILQRLVSEFDVVNEALQRCSLSDMRIGSVGLERLKKTAQIQQVAVMIPSLVRIVPFLDLTPHQEYLVSRIKELSKGGSMSEYRWNCGGSLNGKNWEEHLPTDAALVMHLLATYLDSQLIPLPHHPDGRPFSSQYLVKSPETPVKGRNGLVLYQTHLNPPHFVLIDNEETVDVGKGRNNLFHTLLLFIHNLKTKEHGMLGRVNLGSSGVNMLWVIDS